MQNRPLQSIDSKTFNDNDYHLDPVDNILSDPAASWHQELYHVTEHVHTGGSGQDAGTSVVPLTQVGSMSHQQPQYVQTVVPGQCLHGVQLVLAQVPAPQPPEVSVSVTNSVVTMVTCVEHCCHTKAVL